MDNGENSFFRLISGGTGNFVRKVSAKVRFGKVGTVVKERLKRVRA